MKNLACVGRVLSFCSTLLLLALSARAGFDTSDVVFHYAMDEDDKNVVFTSQVMKEMYEGIYVTGFLLFFGEQMHYFITDDPEEKNIVESGTAGQDVRVMDQSTQRFGMINSIAMNAALMKSREAYQALREYSRLSYLADTLFEWKKE